MIMVPPAGVEPATYRLGGVYSNSRHHLDLASNFDCARPINHASHNASNCLIPLACGFRFGREIFPRNVQSTVELLQSVRLHSTHNN